MRPARREFDMLASVRGRAHPGILGSRGRGGAGGGLGLIAERDGESVVENCGGCWSEPYECGQREGVSVGRAREVWGRWPGCMRGVRSGAVMGVRGAQSGGLCAEPGPEVLLAECGGPVVSQDGVL